MIWGLSLHGWEDVMRAALAIAGASGLIVGLATWFVVKLQREELAASKQEFELYKIDAGQRIVAANAVGDAAKADAAKAMVETARANERTVELQRDLERERSERLKLEQKFGARRFSREQRAAIIKAFEGIRMRVYVRCIDEIEACVAAYNFASVLSEAGLDIPPIEGVGMTIPPSVGIEVYDPAGESGLFARTLLSALSAVPGVRFRPTPFVIAGTPLDPTSPAIIVRMKIPQ